MQRKLNLSLPFDQNLSDTISREYPDVVEFRILSQSLDARKANKGRKPVCNYILEVIYANENFLDQKYIFKSIDKKIHPIIIGAGPAGLFCALRLSEYGIPCTILERGEEANKRMLSIAKFWRKGILNPDSNVCYGEGGAGLFSDGKLITRIKSPLVQYVMDRLVDFGAPKEVAYSSNPHLGSNKIRAIIKNLVKSLEQRGCKIHFETKVTKLLVDSHNNISGVEVAGGNKFYGEGVVLATGHSAGEMYHHLLDLKVAMKMKDFAVGVRVEHPREQIDQLQFGNFAGDSRLGTATYRLSYHNDQSKRGIYSFCMCPGGHVLSSGTDPDGIVVNGMSNYSRRSPWSNSALVVSVQAGRDFKNNHLLSGLQYQREIETRAFNLSKKLASGREIPAMTVNAFLNGGTNKMIPTSNPSGLVPVAFDGIFPHEILESLKEGLEQFNRSLPGFGRSGLLMAPETRTSAPVTILRDENYQSTSHRGLFPCGEGAGHAGGITSAAVDGIYVAEAIIGNQINKKGERVNSP